MTRAQAESELAALEVSEAAAWLECKAVHDKWHDRLLKLEQERLCIQDAKETESLILRNSWLPLHMRKRELKAFLEMI